MARDRDDYEAATQAKRELKRLGVGVTFRKQEGVASA
jgi:hypothetical protein